MWRAHRFVGALLLLLASVVVVLLLVWATLLLVPSLLSSGLARSLPWPIACTIRGCVTTQRWNQLQAASAHFDTTTQQAPQSREAVLTTLVRQHLVHMALPTTTVTQADVARYRTEVLHLTTEESIKQTTGLSTANYQTLVLRPFLEQEALKELRKSASLEDLFHQLAQERPVFILPKGLHWDRDKAAVVSN